MTNRENLLSQEPESSVETRLALSEYTIVPIHGMGQGAWCWKLFNPYIEAAGPKVIDIDLPVDNPRATIEDYISEADRSIEGLKKVVLLLSSAPGRWGTEVARHNAAVEGIVNICASAPYFDDLDIKKIKREEPKRHTKRFENALEDVGDGTVKFKDDKVVDLLFADCLPDIQEWARGNQRAQGQIARRIPVLQRPQNVKIFNLLASEDRAHTAEWGEFAEKEIWLPDATEIIKAGHMPMLSQPAELGRRVIEFIKTLLPEASKTPPGSPGNQADGGRMGGTENPSGRTGLYENHFMLF